MSYLVSFCSCVFFFSPFSIAITSLGEERANLSAFRMFDRLVPCWICRFLPLDVWEGLRFVIVALPGLFSYLCFFIYFTYVCLRQDYRKKNATQFNSLLIVCPLQFES